MLTLSDCITHLICVNNIEVVRDASPFNVFYIQKILHGHRTPESMGCQFYILFEHTANCASVLHILILF